MTTRAVSRLHSFVFAATLVVAAALLRFAAEPWLGRSVPYLFFYPAILLAGIYKGFWPGLLATGVSAIIAFYSFIAPVHRFEISSQGDLIGLILFLVNGAIVSRVSDTARRGAISQEWLASIVQSSDDAIVATDFDGVVTSWNSGAARVFGYSEPEIVGRSITVLIPPERSGEEARVMARIRAGQRVEPFETLRRCQDGSDIDISIAISPIRNAEGDVIGASTIARDISARRRDERLRAELTERERIAREDALTARDRLAFLAEVGTVLASSLDYSETLDRAVHLALPRLGDYCNVLIEDDLGCLQHVAWGHVDRAKEPILRELALLLLESPASSSITFADTIMKTGKSILVAHEVMANAAADLTGLDRNLVRLGEQLMPYAYVGVPLSVRGRIVGVMSFGTTMQESKREYLPSDVVLVEEFARRVALAVENARLFRKADELNRLKDEFLATVSHELRTPLSAVLGWSRMLATGQLGAEKAARAIAAIERNAQAQAQLVEDILDVARGIAGHLQLELAPIDLLAVADGAVDAIAPAAAAKKIEVDMRTRNQVAVVGDPARLRQVVWNLLSNAVKFTPSGGRITVDVTAVEQSAELHVTDTGIGIPREFLPYAFDKFRQADGSFTREHGGLGLGLAIARHIIELHGGTIEARSAGLGTGATFVVRLPVSALEAPA